LQVVASTRIPNPNRLFLDELYAAKCLEHARDLWEFASTYQGSYSAHIETGEKYQVKI